MLWHPKINQNFLNFAYQNYNSSMSNNFRNTAQNSYLPYVKSRYQCSIFKCSSNYKYAPN